MLVCLVQSTWSANLVLSLIGIWFGWAGLVEKVSISCLDLQILHILHIQDILHILHTLYILYIRGI